MKENHYLARALLRQLRQPGGQLRQPGALCDFCELQESQQRPQAQWECCLLQDIPKDIPTRKTMLTPGNDTESVLQAIWNEGCKTQDAIGTRCYRTTYCCETCTEALLFAHTNKQKSAQFAYTLARTNHCALLLMSDRESQLPIIIPIPADTPATDLWPYLDLLPYP